MWGMPVKTDPPAPLEFLQDTKNSNKLKSTLCEKHVKYKLILQINNCQTQMLIEGPATSWQPIGGWTLYLPKCASPSP